jgi:hypothetical protein
VLTLSNSREGEAVGIDPRPRETFPATPNALLAVTDDEGALASVVVLTLLPEGQGGSIVTVPVNADATAGFGVQRRPLDEFFDASDPEAFAVAVSDMLSITIEQTLIVDPAGLEALLAPIESVSAVLPDAAIDTDAIEPGGSTSTTTTPTRTTPTTTGRTDRGRTVRAFRPRRSRSPAPSMRSSMGLWCRPARRCSTWRRWSTC